MSNDIYLRLGDIRGESPRIGRIDWIEVLSFAWQPSCHAEGAAEVLSLKKRVDRATPLIAALLRSGQTVEARLVCDKAGESSFEYLSLHIRRARVTRMIVSGSDADDIAVESVEINYEAATVTVTPQGPDGSPLQAVEFGYEISA